MALLNYSDLNTAVANWSGRTDLTSRIPEGIVLAEAKINRKLRTKDMEVSNPSFPIAGEQVGLPAGFGGVKSFFLNVSPRTIIEYMPSVLMVQNYGDQASGVPKHYTIEAGAFRFGPVPDASYTGTLVYFLQVPALTTNEPLNWLMTSHPDVYLYGVLAEMSAFAKDFQVAQGWETMMYNALAEVMAISNKDKWSGAQLVARPG